MNYKNPRAYLSLALASLALASACASAAPGYYGADAPLRITTRYSDSAGNLSDFKVDQPDTYATGRRLAFTVTGEARSRVSVQMQSPAGMNKTIALTETSRGVYEGAYTIRSTDNFSNPTFRAQLTRGRDVSTAVATVEQRGEGYGYARREREMERQREMDMMRQRELARSNAYSQTRAVCHNCGVIQSVQVIDERVGNNRDNNALGALGGAVVGGLLGNQVGGGSGRDVATIAGALGGAYAGNEVARNQNGNGGIARVFQVNLRMDDGATQSLRLNQNPNLSSGQRVRLENGQIIPDYAR